MNFTLEFLPEASAELECVTGDYEAVEPGLGARFRREIETACDDICANPSLQRVRPGGFRRSNLPGFPYYISFVQEGELILVLAVAHASRHPDYWRRRIP